MSEYQRLVKSFVDSCMDQARDFTIDMMLDLPQDYNTVPGVETALNNNLRAYEETQLDDCLADFCKDVKAVLRRRRFKVRSLTIDDSGFVSCGTVDITDNDTESSSESSTRSF